MSAVRQPDEPISFAGARYIDLIAAALWGYHHGWKRARTKKREDLALRALDVLPSPANEKIAHTIRTLDDSRVIAGIERWLDDKEAMELLRARSRPEEHELRAPSAPTWAPPRVAVVDRDGPPSDMLHLVKDGIATVAASSSDPPDELRLTAEARRMMGIE